MKFISRESTTIPEWIVVENSNSENFSQFKCEKFLAMQKRRDIVFLREGYILYSTKPLRVKILGEAAAEIITVPGVGTVIITGQTTV